MNCAANTAVCLPPRHHTADPRSLRDGFDRSAEALGMEWVSDVAQNIAKGER
jgi:hypothetical protein